MTVNRLATVSGCAQRSGSLVHTLAKVGVLMRLRLSPSPVLFD